MAISMIETYVKRALTATSHPMTVTEIQIWLRKHGYWSTGAPRREGGRNNKGHGCRVVSHQAIQGSLNNLALKGEIRRDWQDGAQKVRVYYVN